MSTTHNDLVARAKEITARERAVYSERTKRSQIATERARKVMPAGVPSSFQAYEPWPVVVKRGPDPAWILCDGRRVEVPALTVDGVRDTTGAGDAFAGGFLTAFVDGADLVESCRAGHIAAATVLATAGAGR